MRTKQLHSQLLESCTMGEARLIPAHVSCCRQPGGNIGKAWKPSLKIILGSSLGIRPADYDRIDAPSYREAAYRPLALRAGKRGRRIGRHVVGHPLSEWEALMIPAACCPRR